MKQDKEDKQRSTGFALVSRMDAHVAAIFSEDRFAYFAFGLVSVIFALELAMNLRNAAGWSAVAHLLIVGPLWLASTGLTVFALIRQFRARLLARASRAPARERR